MEHATMAAFSAYHAAHPRVYQLLRRFAFEAKAAGSRRLSINMLFERVRWEHLVTPSAKGADFALNNNHRAYYARLLMEQEPDLAGLFETRKARADVEDVS